MIILNDIKNEDILQFNYDFSEEIKNVLDIIEINNSHVSAKIDLYEDQLKLNLNIEAKLTLACAKTLKPVLYDLKVSDQIIFANNNDADYPLTNQINLKEIVFGYIMSEKPYTVYHKDAEEIEFDETEEKISPFLELEGMLDK